MFDLINQQSRWCDVAKVDLLFEPNITKEILKINLIWATDRLIWVLEKNGTFNVKSAYKMIQENLVQRFGESSNVKINKFFLHSI